jgi:hypothetical protein
MKTIAALLASLVATAASYAQNTPWPASGNVGIGTTAPNQQLSINGNLSIGSTGSFIMMGQSAYTGGGGYIFLKSTGDYGRDFNIQNYSNAAGWRTNLFVAGETGNVGIGTTSPSAILHVANYNGEYGMLYARNSTKLWGLGSDSNGTYFKNATDGYIPLYMTNTGNVGIGTTNPTGGRLVAYDTSKPPIAWGASSDLGFLSWGSSNEAIVRSTNALKFQTNGGGTDAMWITTGGNVGIGTTNPTEKLSVKGKIRAQEIIVETAGWSDYVFADDYKLQSLADVEAQIKTNKHLPGVPSAQEVSEKGVSLGDMQAVLLAKIEELTLHVINQQKQLNAQQTEIVRLKAQLK